MTFETINRRKVPLGLGLLLAAVWILRRPVASDPAPAARWALAIPDGVTLSTAEYPQIVAVTQAKHSGNICVYPSPSSVAFRRKGTRPVRKNNNAFPP